MTNLFEPNTSTEVDDSTEIQSYRELLVGEGKKFKDEEALARGKYEADRTIALREKELAEIRKELNTRISLEEFLTKQSTSTPPSNGTPQANVEVPANSNEGKPVDVEKAVTEYYTKMQIQAQRAANADSVRKAMKETWGDNAVHRLEQVSRDLNLGKDFLQDLAERSPEAFLQVTGVTKEQKKAPNITPPNTRINSAASPNPTEGVRDEAYWDKQRAANPKFYYSAEAYNMRHKDALALGEDYFS